MEADPQQYADPSILAMSGRTSEASADTLRGARELAKHAAELTGWTWSVCDGQDSHPIDYRSALWRQDLAEAWPLILAWHQVVARNRPALITAGHCAVALATVPTYVAEDGCLLWIDAHGDYNLPETTRSAFLGGMILSGLTGRWRAAPVGGEPLPTIAESQVVLAGVSDLDPAESQLLDNSPVQVLNAANTSPDQVRAALAGRPTFIHLDLDVLDAKIVPAEYPTYQGVQPAALADVLRAVVTGPVLGAEITGLTWQHTGAISRDHPVARALLPLLEGVRIGGADISHSSRPISSPIEGLR